MTSTFGPDFGGSTTMTSELIRATRGWVQGSLREPQNVLESTFQVGTDTATFKYPVTGAQVGQAVEIGWVEYSIVDFNATTRSVTLLPEEGSVHVEHPAGTRVRMRPSPTIRQMVEHFNAELHDLSGSGLYRIVTVDADDDGTITLPSGALRVLDVWSNETSRRRLPAPMYRISDDPAGPTLRGPATLDHAIVGCVFTPLSLTTDQLVSSTTGLMPQALDLLVLGAAMKLLAGREAQRNSIDTQGGTRRAEEVPSSAITSAMRTIASIRQSRLSVEVARLHERYGYMIDVGV